MQDMVKKFTEMGLIDESKEVWPQIQKIKGMSDDQIGKHFADQNHKKFKDEIAANGSHPYEWWDDREHPERIYYLREVMRERIGSSLANASKNEPDLDSENEFGHPVYRRAKCPKYKQLMKQFE